MRIGDLPAFGADRELVRRWSSQIDTLTDVQARAVRAGVLTNAGSLLIAAPTSSGKTFIGEMAATNTVLHGRRSRAVFLVPFKALAEEQYAAFSARYGDLFGIVIATGDRPDADDDVRRGRFNLAVMTYEKLRGFVAQDPSFLDRLGTVVVDEVQNLADAERGPGLELLLTRILRERDRPQLVALSASLDDTGDLGIWLQATSIVSSERAVPLREGVCGLSGEVVFESASGIDKETLVAPQPDQDRLLAQLVIDRVQAGDQVLVFHTTVGRTVQVARTLVSLLPARPVPPAVGERLAALEQTSSVQQLHWMMASGVAYHNAELSFQERAVVEQAFREGALRVLVSTTTLAMGVNLPCDVVIIATAERIRRQDHSWIARPISTVEYKNAAGRAGRLGTRDRGTSILLAGDNFDRDALFRGYVLAPLDPVVSRLAGRRVEDLVFEVLASGTAKSRDELVDFLRATYAYQTFYSREGGGDAVLAKAVDDAVRQCVESGLVEEIDGELRPAAVAGVFAASSVGLETAIAFVRLARAARDHAFTLDDVLYEVCRRREMPAYPFEPEDDPRPLFVDLSWQPSAGSTLGTALATAELAAPGPHAILRMAFLREWVKGAEQRDLSRRYVGANGRRAVDLAQTAAWLVETVARAASVCGVADEFITQLRTLETELRYGLPAALAPLARLDVTGISRADLMRLHGLGRAELLDPELLVETEVEAFDGALSPAQIQRLREKLAVTVRDSLRRRKAEHLIRADAVKLPERLVRQLYEAKGHGLEQAVCEALTHMGLAAKRVIRQPSGEPDVIVEHGGTVLISVTARDDDETLVRPEKVREVLGAGAGLSPVNCVCLGRPGFHTRAEQMARDFAREESLPRRLLLVPIPLLCDVLLAHAQGRLRTDDIGRLLASGRGVLDESRVQDLISPESAPSATTASNGTAAESP